VGISCPKIEKKQLLPCTTHFSNEPMLKTPEYRKTRYEASSLRPEACTQLSLAYALGCSYTTSPRGDPSSDFQKSLKLGVEILDTLALPT
jgi:hypothetical protein